MFLSQLLPKRYCSVSRSTTFKSSSGSISMDFCLELNYICERVVLTTLKTSITVRFISPLGILSGLYTKQTALAAVCWRNAIIVLVRTSIIRHHIVTCCGYVIMQCSLVFFLVVGLCQMSLRETQWNSPLQHFPLAKFYQSLAEWQTVHSEHSHWMLHLHPPVTDTGRALLTHSSSALHLNNSCILCSTSPSYWPRGIFNAVAQQCLTLHCNTASVSLCNQRKGGISARTGGHDGLATVVFLFWLGP